MLRVTLIGNLSTRNPCSHLDRQFLVMTMHDHARQDTAGKF